MSTMDPTTGEVLDEFEEFGAERVEAHFDTMIELLKRSPKTMVMDFGATSAPYLTKGACQMMMRAFRVSVVGAVRRSMERIEDPGGGFICVFRCEGEFEADGLRFPAVGTCATDEKFIAGVKKDGTRFKAWGTVCRDAEAFGETRMMNRAVKAGCMVGALTWDDLERGGIPRSAVGQKTDGQSTWGAQGRNGNNPPAQGTARKTQPPAQQTAAAPAEQKPVEPHGPPMTTEQKLHIARLCDALQLSSEDKQRVIADALGRPMRKGETLSQDVASSIIGALIVDCMDAKINIDQPPAAEVPF